MKIPEPRRLKSGTWFLQLRLNGVSVPVTAPTASECKRSAALIKAEHAAGRRRLRKSDGMTLREAAQAYINVRRGRTSPTTLAGYEKILRNYYQEILDLQLRDITWKTIDAELGRECQRVSSRGKPFSPKTIHSAHSFYMSVLSENRVTFDRDFTLPEEKRKPIQLPTADEVYTAVKGTEIELPCLLAMWLTLSISEIRGLTKSKSIYKGQISVIETVVDVDGKPVRKEGGKEETRSRTLDIPPYIRQLIDAVEGDVICPLSGQAVNKRLQRRLEKFGVRKISFHKLRHISASTMALLDIPSNYAQDRGGWQTDHVMKQTYTHTFTSGRRDADRKMDEHFQGIITGEKLERLELYLAADTLQLLRDRAASAHLAPELYIAKLIENAN